MYQFHRCLGQLPKILSSRVGDHRLLQKQHFSHAAFFMEEQLKTAAQQNAELFKDDHTITGRSLHFGFLNLSRRVEEVTPLLEGLRKIAPNFDFNKDTPGNGYRSFILVFESCFRRCQDLCERVSKEKNNLMFLFNKPSYCSDLHAWNEILTALFTCLEHLHTLIEWGTKDGLYSLFPLSKHSPQELLRKAQMIDQYCFYGRHLGFQFCPSMERAMKFIVTTMAGYSDYYFSTSSQVWRFAKSLFSGMTYALDSEHRAKRVVNVSQFATVDFCKAFWLLAEMDFMQRVPDWFCPHLDVNCIMHVPPELLKIKGEDGSIIDIPIPAAHGPATPIQVRLLSSKKRKGMPGNIVGSGTSEPQSDCLIIHCHGGGFVAQSSKSHEFYLRHWVKDLDVPMLCIDYSLAPDHPFPRPLQEVLYVYAWAMENAQLLGTTAKKVVFAGDSAGANLLLGAALWASQLGLRLPTGIFLAYVPVLIQFVPSPSRLLCLTDPMLPFGFMMRCLNAYAGHSTEHSDAFSEDNSDSDSVVVIETSEELSSKSSSLDDLASKKDVSDKVKRSSLERHSTVQDASTLDRLQPHNPTEELDIFRVPSNPLLSPYLASDAALKKMPPISFLTVQLDPCLDDCVEFAKKLHRLGVPVTLDILEGLPHGFLSFELVSPEAREGSKRCAMRIAQLFERDQLSEDQIENYSETDTG